ncbi:MAG: ABC transporter permease subunit [Polyangiaceae bacterium]|nr:ABC transporter permease subunit [Polyangiaceae bacterium]
MTKAFLIAGRELGAYRRSWLGPAVIAAALLLDGILFYGWVLTEKLLSAEALAQFFYIASGPMMGAAILLSMRLVAEERQTGTITLLNTAPVTEFEMVLGKFLALLTVLAVMTLLSGYMPALLLVRGKVSLAHVVTGYAGLFLLGSTVASIGLFASSLTRSQIIAAILALVIFLPLLAVWVIARFVDPPLNQFLSGLALHHENYRPFMDGVLEFHRVVYYLVVTAFFLLAATKTLEARRWR